MFVTLDKIHTILQFLLGGHTQNDVHDLQHVRCKERVSVLEHEEETLQDRCVFVEIFAKWKILNEHWENLHRNVNESKCQEALGIYSVNYSYLIHRHSTDVHDNDTSNSCANIVQG